MADRTLNVGGNQGRGDPSLSHSTKGPGLLVSPYFYVGGVMSLAVWCALVWIFWGHA